jgi:Flp pilus assembly protein TadG
MTTTDYLRRALLAFRRDRRGNVAVIFAIALLPLLAFVGVAIDYSMASRARAKLQAAADAASVAALSLTSPGFSPPRR